MGVPLDFVRQCLRNIRQRWDMHRNTIVNCIVIWFVLKMVFSALMLFPGPWGPSVSGRLPDRRTVIFQSRFYGRESDDVLIVRDRSGLRENWYWVNNFHAAKIRYVRIAINAKKDLIWVESRGSVLASLDLASDTFVRAPLPGASYGGGETLAQGGTRGWWQYVVPW